MKHWLIVNKRELSKKGERVSVTITKVGAVNMPHYSANILTPPTPVPTSPLSTMPPTLQPGATHQRVP